MGLSNEQREALRERCRRDLFFLGRDVLHYDFEEQPHREMLTFFVRKDPSRPLEDQSEIKERQLLAPRGSFKSTASVVDAVQWTICFPNIRLFTLCGEKGLANAFATEYRNIFTVQRDNPTDFQLLFPEFCISAPVREPFNEYTSPARTRFYKEPTFWVSSIGSSLPGWHCDVLRLDDVVNDKNAANDEQIEKTNYSINLARKLVDPGRYIEVIGTPYALNDYYDYQRKHADPKKFAFMIRPARTVKANAASKKPEELTKEDYEFYFPKRLTHEFLQSEEKYDPISFRTQYLVDATGAEGQVFTEEILDRATVPWETLDRFSTYYAIWDLSYSADPRSTSVTAGGIVQKDSEGRLAAIELVAERFTPLTLAAAIVDYMVRYPVQFTAIEEAPGARWLEPEIQRLAEQRGVQANIYWIPIDKTKDAKKLRIALLADFMKRGIFRISSACVNMSALREYFLAYNEKKTTLKDVPDMFALGAKLLCNTASSEVLQEEREAAFAELKRRALHELIFPSVPVTAPIEVMPEPPLEDSSSFLTVF